MRARSSFQVHTTALRSSFWSWMTTVRAVPWLPLRMSLIQAYRLSAPMIPRLSVTSAAFVKPVSLRTLFSLSLPLRYSVTATSIPMPLHS